MEIIENEEKLSGISQVWERLFLGGLAYAERLAKLNPFGITNVISLCEEQSCIIRPEINYIHIPIEDDQKIHILRLDRIIGAISENIRRGKGLVHCGGRISRAPIFALICMWSVISISKRHWKKSRFCDRLFPLRTF